ncbi:MAG: hypothetical protein LUG57_00045 [Oscillospiraceae bacterium]|nr:hypothetical protein [Oscillospiraceae bacterium]
MTGWAVSGIIIPSLVLLGLLPVRVSVSWEGGAFSLKIMAGPVPFRVLPKKPERGRHKTPSAGKANREPVCLPPPVLKALALRGLDALGRLIRRGRVDTLRLHYTAAGPDPYRAAMTYLAVGTAMEGLLAAADGRVSHPDLRAAVDFDGGEPELFGTVTATVRLYRAAAVAGRFALGFWGDWRAYRKNRKGAEDSE